MSVVIATYNRGPAIGRTITSVLAQTVQPVEVIVVDDGSTDGTAAWLREHYPQVDVYTFANGGTSLARNRGADLARGDILVFLDHDDEMRPHAVATLTRLLERCPAAVAAFADHALTDGRTGAFHANHHDELPSFARLRAVRALGREGSACLFGRAMYHALLCGNLLQQPWAVHRDVFLALGGFDPGIRYCEDWELFLRVAAHGQLVVSGEVISDHFIQASGTNLSLSVGQQEWYLRVLRKHLARAAWYDLRARVLLRRRLGVLYKAAGDSVGAANLAFALRSYAASLVAWPFDHVVAARCVLWASALLARRAAKHCWIAGINRRAAPGRRERW